MAADAPNFGKDPASAAYEGRAEELAAAYESVAFEAVHGPVLDLLPPAPAPALDVGAGSGRDAAALARRGHRVLAVEPSAALRDIARRLHPHPRIEWLDDALPLLARVSARQEAFALVLLSGVWMHVPPEERPLTLGVLAGLLRPGGLLALNFRHPPDSRAECTPPTRRRWPRKPVPSASG